MLAGPVEPVTARLTLRQWRAADGAPFAAMGADPAVMRYFAGLLDTAASLASIAGWQQGFEARGWSNWALERRDTGEFIGIAGLSAPRRTFSFSPCGEIGWRLAPAFRCQAFASEAARTALQAGFTQPGLDAIVSFTSLLNLPTRAMMRRIGRVDTGQDLDHPAPPEASPLRRHCLYRIERRRWTADGAQD